MKRFDALLGRALPAGDVQFPTSSPTSRGSSRRGHLRGRCLRRALAAPARRLFSAHAARCFSSIESEVPQVARAVKARCGRDEPLGGLDLVDVERDEPALSQGSAALRDALRRVQTLRRERGDRVDPPRPPAGRSRRRRRREHRILLASARRAGGRAGQGVFVRARPHQLRAPRGENAPLPPGGAPPRRRGRAGGPDRSLPVAELERRPSNVRDRRAAPTRHRRRDRARRSLRFVRRDRTAGEDAFRRELAAFAGMRDLLMARPTCTSCSSSGRSCTTVSVPEPGPCSSSSICGFEVRRVEAEDGWARGGLRPRDRRALRSGLYYEGSRCARDAGVTGFIGRGLCHLNGIFRIFSCERQLHAIRAVLALAPRHTVEYAASIQAALGRLTHTWRSRVRHS